MTNRNLFICMTPLQILISLNIIIKESLETNNVDFLVVTYQKNNKVIHYINRLKQLGYHVYEYNIISNNKFTRTLDLIKLYRYLNNSGLIYKLNYNDVFVASIDNLSIHFLLDKLSFNHLYTFDDGLANLNLGGSYYRSTYTLIYKLIYRTLKVKWDIHKIKSRSLKHYSIFPSRPNIIEEVESITLLPPVLNSSINKPVLNLYIGQPLQEIDRYFKRINFDNLLLNYDIDYYIPHPRETKLPLNAKIYHSDKIIEEIYCDLIKTYDVRVYTFFSTAVINLFHIDPCAKIYVFQNRILLNRFSNLYEVLDRYNFNYTNIGEWS